MLQKLRIQLVIYNLNKKIYYEGEETFDDKIFLLKNNAHINFISSLKSFLCVEKICDYCGVGYMCANVHICEAICKFCIFPLHEHTKTNRDRNQRQCGTCNRLFYSEECYKFHKMLKGKQEKSLCEKSHFCKVCGHFLTPHKFTNVKKHALNVENL